MPTPAELQQLSDEIRRAGAMLVQVAHDGDPEILMMIVNVLNACAAKPAWWAREAQAAEVDQIVADIIGKRATAPPCQAPSYAMAGALIGNSSSIRL